MNLALEYLIVKPRASGLSVTTFTQALGDELVVNGGFSSSAGWTLETGWTVGSGVATKTNNGSLSAVYRDAAFESGAEYEIAHEITAYTSGSLRMGVGTLSYGAYHSSAVASNEIVPMKGGAVIVLLGSTNDFAGSADNMSAKLITKNAVATMPSVDGTHTFTFTLPGTPKAGQRAEMRYHYDDASNYRAALVIRNAANSAYDFLLDSVESGTRTNLFTVEGVGTPNAVRVVTSGTTHTAYTGASGTFTQRGDPQTIAALGDGITSIYVSAFTPVSLTSF